MNTWLKYGSPERHLQSATARQVLRGNEGREAGEESLVLLVSPVPRAPLVQKAIRENKAIRGLGACQASPQLLPYTAIRSSPSRVTKDKQGLQDPQALLVQEAHLGTQERMAPEGCPEYPVNQGNQENKA